MDDVALHVDGARLWRSYRAVRGFPLLPECQTLSTVHRQSEVRGPSQPSTPHRSDNLPAALRFSGRVHASYPKFKAAESTPVLYRASIATIAVLTLFSSQ